MTTNDWIFILIIAITTTATISWLITYTVMTALNQNKCDEHNFEKVLYKEGIGYKSVTYMCTKCGKVKKVT